MVAVIALPLPTVLADTAAMELEVFVTWKTPAEPVVPVLMPLTPAPLPLVSPYTALLLLLELLSVDDSPRFEPLSVIVTALELPLYVIVTGGLKVVPASGGAPAAAGAEGAMKG